MRIGARAPLSLSACTRSIEVGSNHCKSSRTRTSGWLRRAAGGCPLDHCGQLTAARSPPAKDWACGQAERECRPSGQAKERASRRRAGRQREVIRVRPGAARKSTSGPPNLTRPHPRIGCSGVFCSNCDELHSTQECRLSASWPRNSSTSRDLPMPVSPTIRTFCPSPASARSEQRGSRRRSFSRATKGVNRGLSPASSASTRRMR